MFPFGMQKWQCRQGTKQAFKAFQAEIKSSRFNGPNVPVKFSGICQDKSKVEAQKPRSLSPRASPRIQNCWLHKPTCLASPGWLAGWVA